MNVYIIIVQFSDTCETLTVRTNSIINTLDNNDNVFIIERKHCNNLWQEQRVQFLHLDETPNEIHNAYYCRWKLALNVAADVPFISIGTISWFVTSAFIILISRKLNIICIYITQINNKKYWKSTPPQLKFIPSNQLSRLNYLYIRTRKSKQI